MVGMRSMYDAKVNVDTWQGASPLPPLDDQARERAREQPGQTIYYPDITLPSDAPLVQEKVVGSRTINEAGEYDSHWINPDYVPSREIRGNIDFLVEFDADLWRMWNGFASFYTFIKRFAETKFFIAVDPQTREPEFLHDEEDNRTLPLYTDTRHMPQGSTAETVPGLNLVEDAHTREGDLVISLNPGSPLHVGFWLHHLAELHRQRMQQLADAHPDNPPPGWTPSSRP